MNVPLSLRADEIIGRRQSFKKVGALEELAAIFERDINVVELERRVEHSLLEEAQRALQESTFRIRTTTEPSAATTISELKAFPQLEREVQHWSCVLSDLSGSEEIGVRLARLDKAMCPRFHVDHVPLRLVCTFAGEGTEYLANSDVDRSCMKPLAGIQRAALASVVLLKGEGWPGQKGLGAVHRSPAQRMGSARLVMTLDLF